MSSTLHVPSTGIPHGCLASLWSPGGQHLGRGLRDLVVEGWDVARLPQLNPAQFCPCIVGCPCPAQACSLGFAKGSVGFGVELNILLVPRCGGGGVCSLPQMTSVPGHLLPRSKGSEAELWRPWLFFPQHYWVFFWLLLLSIAFLLLIRVLELQRLQSAASSKA